MSILNPFTTVPPELAPLTKALHALHAAPDSQRAANDVVDGSMASAGLSAVFLAACAAWWDQPVGAFELDDPGGKLAWDMVTSVKLAAELADDAPGQLAMAADHWNAADTDTRSVALAVLVAVAMVAVGSH